jgi:hypothetical protein
MRGDAAGKVGQASLLGEHQPRRLLWGGRSRVWHRLVNRFGWQFQPAKQNNLAARSDLRRGSLSSDGGRRGGPRRRSTYSPTNRAPGNEKAVACLTKDRETLLAFFDFPAEHCDHLRTSNPIESEFATVRHQTVRTKAAQSAKTAKLMVFKMTDAAAKTWLRLKGENQLPKVIARPLPRPRRLHAPHRPRAARAAPDSLLLLRHVVTALPSLFFPTTIGNIAGDGPHDPAMRHVTPSPRANDDRRAVAAQPLIDIVCRPASPAIRSAASRRSIRRRHRSARLTSPTHRHRSRFPHIALNTSRLCSIRLR